MTRSSTDIWPSHRSSSRSARRRRRCARAAGLGPSAGRAAAWPFALLAAARVLRAGADRATRRRTAGACRLRAGRVRRARRAAADRVRWRSRRPGATARRRRAARALRTLPPPVFACTLLLAPPSPAAPSSPPFRFDRLGPRASAFAERSPRLGMQVEGGFAMRYVASLLLIVSARSIAASSASASRPGRRRRSRDDLRRYARAAPAVGMKRTVHRNAARRSRRARTIA